MKLIYRAEDILSGVRAEVRESEGRYIATLLDVDADKIVGIRNYRIENYPTAVVALEEAVSRAHFWVAPYPSTENL